MIRKLTLTTFIALVALLIVLPFASIAGEKDCDCGSCDMCKEPADGFSLMGDFRWRAEADGKDFNGDTDMGTYSSLRSRLGLKFKAHNTSAFVQLQYPFNLGWNSKPDTLGKFGTDNLDVHQAYIVVKNLLWSKNAWFKAGRYEMNYADERLIGGVGWSNIGRSFEGFTLGHMVEDMYWADIFVTRQNEPRSIEYSGEDAKNDLFAGIWFNYIPLKLNIFALHNRDADTTLNTDGSRSWRTSLSRNTFGYSYWNMYESMNLAVLSDFAFQMGKSYPTPGDDDTAIDLSAWMFVLSLGYKLDIQNGLWLGGGVDITSGDDPTSADKNEGFSNLYYTGHKWRGYMDFFTADKFIVDPTDPTNLDKNTNPGLMNIFINALFFPKMHDGKCNLLAEFHIFSTMQDYVSMADPTVTDARSIGMEINLVRKHQIRENTAFEMGLGYFMPNEDFVGKDKDNALWAYLQLSSKFDMHVDMKE